MSAPVALKPALTWGQRYEKYAKGVMAAIFFALSVGTQFLDTIGAMGLSLPPSATTSISGVLGVLGTAFVVLTRNNDAAVGALDKVQVVAEGDGVSLGRLRDAKAALDASDQYRANIEATLAYLREIEAGKPGAVVDEALSQPVPVNADASKAPSVWSS